ncbi:hypothetical protein CLI92_09005 [Vandammella animalimorsus]|uniref:Uncharacterized protein n=1 Tax=Vandammella animalimorsus TaxID=2029117 RepID=A0A2A2T4J1_9BURK|nr:hypothetical protein [Vandammella animalimorsus]PAT31891.1 hypothetical protein CK626_07800 [Vandammella animalimorsus]PAX16462.1 hypothetical protein CLI92_09005 [Vandammella animalimorsus]PAX18877.1 hypothetical protein CLI93_11085 [Vandammella animalimorsus]
MATTRAKKQAATEEAVAPPAIMTTPAQMGMAHGMDAVFVWQQMTDVQKTLGAIDAKLDQHKESVAKLEADIARIKSDVSEFKQIRHTAKVLAWVIGVAAAAFMTVTGYIAKEAWGILKPHAMNAVAKSEPVTQAKSRP